MSRVVGGNKGGLELTRDFIILVLQIRAAVAQLDTRPPDRTVIRAGGRGAPAYEAEG
jgi:hypothetical protein